jgi:hypothetical protein
LRRKTTSRATAGPHEIECLAIAAKRYGLFTRRPDGTPVTVSNGTKKKRSEHGMGHLLPPNAPSPEISDTAWIDEWWEHLLHLELGFEDHPEPAWFDQPAIGRLTVTSQRDIKALTTYNQQKLYTEQVKPWGFLTIAHPADHERAAGIRTLIAPFERNPAKRLHANGSTATNQLAESTPPEHQRITTAASTSSATATTSTATANTPNRRLSTQPMGNAATPGPADSYNPGRSQPPT